MAILPILKYPDPRLREKSLVVTSFDHDLQALALNLAHTMLAAPGAGLAAPQVGHLLQMIVIAGVENDEDFDDQVLTLINPRISCAEGELSWEEGCLSVTDLNENVIRAKTIQVNYKGLDGQSRQMEAWGRRAVILQHEIDHLNGILFIDHISRLKRDIYRRRLKKLQKEEA